MMEGGADRTRVFEAERPGFRIAVRPPRPHLVTNAGGDSVVFLVLQLYDGGEYDFVPLAAVRGAEG